MAFGVNYDLWYHGAFRSTPNRHNMVGILTESASTRLATPIFLAKKDLKGASRGLPEYTEAVNFSEPWPGGWWRAGRYPGVPADFHFCTVGNGRPPPRPVPSEPDQHGGTGYRRGAESIALRVASARRSARPRSGRVHAPKSAGNGDRGSPGRKAVLGRRHLVSQRNVGDVLRSTLSTTPDGHDGASEVSRAHGSGRQAGDTI